MNNLNWDNWESDLKKSVAEREQFFKGQSHKYFKREGTPGHYKYYYTEQEWKEVHPKDGGNREKIKIGDHVQFSLKGLGKLRDAKGNYGPGTFKGTVVKDNGKQVVVEYDKGRLITIHKGQVKKIDEKKSSDKVVTLKDFKIGAKFIDPEGNKITLIRKYDEGIWEARGASGDRLVNESEAKHYKLDKEDSDQKSSVKISSKDWSRMLDLYLADKDGAGVAHSIKDKNKAIARYVAGIKLAGKEPEYNNILSSYSGWFSDFADRALELGVTKEEISSAFNSVKLPNDFAEKLKSMSSKKLNNRFVGDLSKSILKEDFDIDFLNKGGNALTLEGRDAMRRNGRKWTIGYKTEITLKDGKKVRLDFDAITDEGDGPTNYAIDTRNSSDIFIKKHPEFYGVVGKRKFISYIIDSLKKIK